MFNPIHQMEIGVDATKNVVTKKLRPCIPRTCFLMVFMMFMSGTALLSNSVHWVPNDSFEVVEGVGEIRTTFSFVPFWMSDDKATYKKKGNVLLIPSFANGDTLYKKCELTYDVNSFSKFAQLFGSGNVSSVNRFVLDVSSRLERNLSVETAEYSVTSLKCKEARVVNYLTKIRRDVFLGGGRRNYVTIPRFFYGGKLFRDCNTSYVITSLDQFNAKFNVGEKFMDALKLDILEMLEMNHTVVASEYQVINMTCDERIVCPVEPTESPITGDSDFTADPSNQLSTASPGAPPIILELTIDVTPSKKRSSRQINLGR